jgi:hypothetical protein
MLLATSKAVANHRQALADPEDPLAGEPRTAGDTPGELAMKACQRAKRPEQSFASLLSHLFFEGHAENGSSQVLQKRDPQPTALPEADTAA